MSALVEALFCLAVALYASLRVQRFRSWRDAPPPYSARHRRA